MYIYIHVASRVSVMTTINPIMLKMVAPITKHCSMAPGNGKNKWYENVYQCAANLNKGWQLNFSLRFNLKKQWNTIIRSENIDFVYMLMENYVLLSRTEIFNVMV